MEHRIHHRHVVVAAMRPSTREHLVENHTERPDVGRLVRSVAGQLFRGHVGDRADRDAGLRQPGQSRELRDTEIENLDDAVVRDHQIGRLDVAVDDAGFMRLDEAPGYLRGDIDSRVCCERSTLNSLLERLALVAGHGEKHLAVGRFVDLVDGADIRVIESRGCACLLHEPLLGVFVSRQIGGQKLESYRSTEPRVLGPVDNAHAAPAELVADAVVRDCLALHRDMKLMTDGVYVGGTVGLQIQFLRFLGALHDEATALQNILSTPHHQKEKKSGSVCHLWQVGAAPSRSYAMVPDSYKLECECRPTYADYPAASCHATHLRASLLPDRSLLGLTLGGS